MKTFKSIKWLIIAALMLVFGCKKTISDKSLLKRMDTIRIYQHRADSFEIAALKNAILAHQAFEADDKLLSDYHFKLTDALEKQYSIWFDLADKKIDKYNTIVKSQNK